MRTLPSHQHLHDIVQTAAHYRKGKTCRGFPSEVIAQATDAAFGAMIWSGQTAAIDAVDRVFYEWESLQWGEEVTH